MSKFTIRKRTGGFTLIEIMIVVLIIGILLAIAVPNFIKARETSRAKACVANLQQLQSAIQQWAMDNKATTGTAVTMDEICGNGLYINVAPQCPSGGAYTVATVDTNPTCSIGANANPTYSHVLAD